MKRSPVWHEPQVWLKTCSPRVACAALYGAGGRFATRAMTTFALGSKRSGTGAPVLAPGSRYAPSAGRPLIDWRAATQPAATAAHPRIITRDRRIHAPQAGGKPIL